MDQEQGARLPPIYVSKRRTVRTDVLTRQALVPPIFRRKEQLKRDAKYLQVHYLESSGESVTSLEDTNRNELYLRYRTEFNYLSPELILNRQSTGCDETPGKRKVEEADNNDNDYNHRKGIKGFVETGNITPSGEKKRKSKNGSKEEAACSIPKSPWLDRMLPVMLRFINQKGTPTDKEKHNVKDEILNLYKAGKHVDEASLREAASVLSSVVERIDDWTIEVKETSTKKITIEEARSLMDDFRDICGGLIKVDLATQMTKDIKTCEAFGAKVRMTMTTLSSSAERMVSLDEVESLLKEAQGCRFLVPEVVALQSIFRNLVSLRYLMESSVIDLDLSECESLVVACGKGIVRLPKLDELRRHLQESVWLHSANKVCQRPVKYSMAKSLVATIPESLRDHHLCDVIKQKCIGVEHWLQEISQYSFFKSVTNEQKVKVILSKGESGKNVAHLEDKAGAKRCDVKKFEELCTTYQNLQLTLPLFRSIEPLYQSLRRLQRRYNKIENMINSNSRNPNIATDCIWLLQHSEALSEFIDLTEYLQPIRSGVESWLNYEKKCRKVLDAVKSFNMSREINRLKNDWNLLLNLRKTSKLSDSDLNVIIDLMKGYECESRIAFKDVRELEEEFSSLRIKNLVLQRELNEISEKGAAIMSKVNIALENVKEDTSKSEAVLVHLVLVILEVLKFGAKMDCMPKLKLCMDYLMWSRTFYSLVFGINDLGENRERLRTLAKEGATDEFHTFTKHILVHDDVMNHVNGLSCIPEDGSSPKTELDLLMLLAA